VIGPLLLIALLALIWRLRSRPLPPGCDADVFPHDYRLFWLVLITQNVLAQLVTGPWSSWNEVAFSIYYLILFVLTAVIAHHFHCLKRARAIP